MIKGLVGILLLTSGAAWAEATPDWLSKLDPELLNGTDANARVEAMLELPVHADLGSTAQIRSIAERRRAVVTQLRQTAASSQAPLLALLAARGIEHRAYWISNAIHVHANRADLELLAARADVQHLHWIAPTSMPEAMPRSKARRLAKAEPLIEPALTLMRVPEVWSLGHFGQGIVVGDHDIGVEWEHPALKRQYRGWDEAAQTADHRYNWLNAFPVDPFCTEAEVPCDSNGHGTHTTGTMVGDDGAGTQIGMAPQAKWIACRSLLDPVVGVGTVPTYMTCMEWMLAPYPTGDSAAADPAMAPDVVNNSWGCLEACAPPLLKDINAATKAAGIVQVASAGNEGSECSTTLAPPGVYEDSFTVGATDNADQMADFSSRGPVLSDLSMRLKPNVVAPGVDTLSSLPGGEYGELSGTSMASPHVAGLVALILSAEPRLIGRVDEVRQLIEQTSIPITGDQTCGGTSMSDIPNNIFGYGRIDALAAIQSRPRFSVDAQAPEQASRNYSASVSVALAEEAKLAASGVLVRLTLPPGLSLDSASETPSASEATDSGTQLEFSRAQMNPGESWDLQLQLSASDGGEKILVAQAEADQVSPVSDQTRTLVGGSGGGGSNGESDAGRFGSGALDLGVLPWLFAAAALRRRFRLRPSPDR